MSDTWVANRNGYRPRAWETRVGEMELLIPASLRARRIFQSFGAVPGWALADRGPRALQREITRIDCA